MLLFHFTSFGHMPKILASGGLRKGDVMCGEHGEQTLCATWLTTDPNPANCHGLSLGGLVEFPSEFARATAGRRWTETVNKSTVRITVKIPSTDRRLKQWTLWAKGRVGQQHYDWEVETSGGKAAAERFYFYEPLIPVQDFVKIELFHDFDRTYHVATNEQLACLREHEVGYSFRSPLAPRDN